MLQISCPFCGPRDEIEFTFGGESHIQRPSPEVSDSEWADYLYCRDNPKGVHHERWQHRDGCRQWFNIERDTVTHQIYRIYRMDEPRYPLRSLQQPAKSEVSEHHA